jgi:uncharacterized protein YceK
MKMPMPIRSLLRSVVFSLCLVLLGGCSTVLSTVRVVERRDGVSYGEADDRRGGGLVQFYLDLGPYAAERNAAERQRAYTAMASACGGGAFEISRELLGHEDGAVVGVAIPVGSVAVVTGSASASPVRYLEFRCRPGQPGVSPARPVCAGAACSPPA